MFFHRMPPRFCSFSIGCSARRDFFPGVCSFEQRRPFLDHFVTALLALDTNQCVLWPGSQSVLHQPVNVSYICGGLSSISTLGIFRLILDLRRLTRELLLTEDSTKVVSWFLSRNSSRNRLRRYSRSTKKSRRKASCLASYLGNATTGFFFTFPDTLSFRGRICSNQIQCLAIAVSQTFR